MLSVACPERRRCGSRPEPSAKMAPLRALAAPPALGLAPRLRWGPARGGGLHRGGLSRGGLSCPLTLPIRGAAHGGAVTRFRVRARGQGAGGAAVHDHGLLVGALRQACVSPPPRRTPPGLLRPNPLPAASLCPPLPARIAGLILCRCRASGCLGRHVPVSTPRPGPPLPVLAGGPGPARAPLAMLYAIPPLGFSLLRLDRTLLS